MSVLYEHLYVLYMFFSGIYRQFKLHEYAFRQLHFWHVFRNYRCHTSKQTHLAYALKGLTSNTLIIFREYGCQFLFLIFLVRYYHFRL